VLLSELATAIENAKKIFSQIKTKYPAIRAFLILSTRHGQAPIDASLEFLLDQADYFFVETDAVKSVWKLLDQIFDENEKLKENRRIWPPSYVRENEGKIQVLQRQYQALIPAIEINEEVEICLRWDEIDFEANRLLRSDQSLVDTSRTPQLGGIKICLGTVGNLAKKE
jgi:hypothetical protein